jgi:hypothetical protein
MAQSKLTSLSRERSAQEMQMLSRDSIQWLNQKISNLRGISQIPSTIAKEQMRYTNQFRMGKLYFFYYDPKGKDDLPYYDKFPLVLTLERYPDSFLGLNLHYLPIKYRIAFLAKLMDFASYNANDEIQRLRITYDILSASKRLKEFKPCIKKYLISNIRSKILTVEPNEWEVATFLPIHQFKGAKPDEVWKESLDEIRKS